MTTEQPSSPLPSSTLPTVHITTIDAPVVATFQLEYFEEDVREAEIVVEERRSAQKNILQQSKKQQQRRGVHPLESSPQKKSFTSLPPSFPIPRSPQYLRVTAPSPRARSPHTSPRRSPSSRHLSPRPSQDIASTNTISMNHSSPSLLLPVHQHPLSSPPQSPSIQNRHTRHSSLDVRVAALAIPRSPSILRSPSLFVRQKYHGEKQKLEQEERKVS